MARRITEEYITEKVEAYNVAINALEGHETGSDGDADLAYALRMNLKKRLNSELNRWIDRVSTDKVESQDGSHKRNN